MAGFEQKILLCWFGYFGEELAINGHILSLLIRRLLQYIVSDRGQTDPRRCDISKRASPRLDGSDYPRFRNSVPAYALD